MSEIEIVGGLLDHYTPVPNDLFRTPGIKSRAVHVYGNLRSNRSGWKTNTRNVAESTGLNRRTVMDAINDLIELGYVERVAIAGKDGEFASYKYRVFDSPRGAENAPGDVVQKMHRDVVQKVHQVPGAESAPIKKNSFKKNNKEYYPPNPPGGTHRLPDDWQPSQDLIADISKKHPGVDLTSEAIKFRDYWHQAAGATSVKKDWDRAFRNWVRKVKPSWQDRRNAELAQADVWSPRTGIIDQEAPF